MSGIPYAGTSRGLVRFLMINVIISYLIGMLLQYPENLYLNASNIAVKSRYSLAFSVNFPLSLRGSTRIEGDFISVISLFIYKFRFFVFMEGSSLGSRGELTSRSVFIFCA